MYPSKDDTPLAFPVFHRELDHEGPDVVVDSGFLLVAAE